ncbi:MAG: CPBP family intramembrane metalloprotease [Sphingobacteriales bacterium]|nr:MAG: CPBP family intramembrane metalloprotease [Sphingobacteriales bacterium]
MFNRYWREFPWWLQVLQFFIMVFIFLGFFTIISALVLPRVTGVTLASVINISETASVKEINALLIFQFLYATFLFIIPTLLFAYVAHPSPGKYLGLTAPRKPFHWILSILILLSILPTFLAITNWLSQFDFGASLKEMQEKNEKLSRLFLTMPTFGEFLKTFLVLAIMPAVSEELFFRGMVMRFAAKKFKNPVFPILISAILFAWLHSNIYGLPSIFAAGVLLGIIYHLTGSLWCSILAHMVHNGLQVALYYISNNNPAFRAILDNNEVPISFVVVGLAIFGLCIFLLWKSRTPLAKNWADDFAGEKPESTDNFTA